MADWFVTGNPLTHLGQTMGRGVSSAPPAQQSAANIANAENILAETKRQNDRNYALKKREVDQQYQAAKLQAKTQRERNQIDKWYNQEQVRLAGERLAQDKYEFEQEAALKRAGLGYDVLNMAANLRGPENYYQAAAFARGVAADPNSATFLNALKDNTSLRSYGAQYGVPDPETLGTLSAKLGTQIGGGNAPAFGSAAAGPDDSLNQIRGIYARGAHRLAPGALERMTGTEQKLLKSGIDAIGGDYATFLDQYQRSRVGNRANMASVA